MSTWYGNDSPRLTPTEVEALGAALDGIRRDVEQSRGARDARYIQRVITCQRGLELVSRAVILTGSTRTRRWVGTLGLAAAKIIENMELGHNIGHGQWDWMNDVEIHSSQWEWDMVAPSSQWRYAHNYRHHHYTNVFGLDDDIGFSVLRVTSEQDWHWRHLFQPLQVVLLALTFEWAVALYDLDAAHRRVHTLTPRASATSSALTKIGRQVLKDYVLFPTLTGRRWRQTLWATAVANVIRNVWTYLAITCGHFPDGAETFTADSIADETRGQWYLRQILGSNNFTAGPVLRLATGHLCYQIEHHLFPDLPSNRYDAISVEVRALCEKYDVPYTTGPFLQQLWQTHRTILTLSLPRANRRMPAAA